MIGFTRPQCPYCEKKVDLITAWMLRRKGEYQCSRCRGVSNVKMDMKTPYIAAAAVLTTLILFFLIHFVFRVETLNSLFWILLPIILFYIASMFLVRLKKPVIKKVLKKKKGTNSSRNPVSNTQRVNYKHVSNDWNTQNNIEQTKIL